MARPAKSVDAIPFAPYQAIINLQEKKVIQPLPPLDLTRDFGESPSFGLSSLLYVPVMRSSKIIKEGAHVFSVGYSRLETKASNEDDNFISEMDFEVQRFALSYRYGLSYGEVQVRTGFSSTSGDMSLVNKIPTPTNVIPNSTSDMSLADTSIDFYMNLDHLRPFKVMKGEQRWSHSFGIGVKVPTGSVSDFSSSGSLDAALHMLHSCEDFGYENLHVDVGYHLVVPGDLDEDIVSEGVDAQVFGSGEVTVSYYYDEASSYFAGVSYSTAPFDGPFDEYELSGAKAHVGVRHVLRKDIKRFIAPKFLVSIADRDAISLQAHIEMSL
jgi:hypothetical protein